MIARKDRTPDAGNATRMTALAVIVSSALVGAVAFAETELTEVGTEKSNVDKKSSSGAYYPYAAGTVGDDPSEPKSTKVPEDTLEETKEPTEQRERVGSNGKGCPSEPGRATDAASLAASFDAMDADKDGKVTREEFTAWHDSRSARLNAD